jgi:hypothetical protein
MSEYKMSPLAHVLMGVLRKGAWIAAGMIMLFAGILVYQRMTPEGSVKFQDGDIGFLAVLAVMLALAVYLVRGIGKEMERPGE